MTEHTRTCTKCGETRSIFHFYKYNKKAQRRRTVCKDCSSSFKKKWQTTLAETDERFKRSIGDTPSVIKRKRDNRHKKVEERIQISRAIVDQLISMGWNMMDISKTTGVDRQVISRLRHRKPTKFVRKNTEERLAAMLVREKRKHHGRS